MARPARRPDPPPLETDDVRAIGIGTAVWALMLVGLLPFSGRLAATGRGWWSWTCLAGLLLGLIGIAYCHRRRAKPGRGPTEPALREPLP